MMTTDLLPSGTARIDQMEMRGITKRFPGVLANDGVNFDVRSGEVHALLGENGAGKSTLMKILYGLERPDSGRILLDGKAVAIPNPAAAALCGIGMVSQHAEIVGEFTVAQNVSLCAEPRRFAFFYDRKAAEREVGRLAAENGFGLDPRVPASSLSAAEIQELEILKLLWRRASLLILDEPTSLLAEHEVEGLFSSLKRLRAAGKTIILITHKLREIMAITDRVTVMRRGEVVALFDTKNTSVEELAEAMVGRSVLLRVDKKPARPGETVLDVKNLTWKDRKGVARVDNVSFSVRKGEIVGIAGVSGNGQSELLDVIAGITRPASGTVTVFGEPYLASRAEITRHGIGSLPEEPLPALTFFRGGYGRLG